MGKTTSIVLSDELDKAINQMVGESARREDCEAMSRSEIMRRLIADGIERTDVGELLSEERRILLLRDQFKNESGKVQNLRSGFEPRVKRHFKERFENGMKPEGLDQFAENMVRDARILWPEWSDEDYSDRRQAAIEYVEQVCEAAKDARQRSDYDPLNPSTIFDGYEGVERGAQVAEIEQARQTGEIEDWHAKARDQVSRIREMGATPQRAALIDSLQNQGAPEGVAIEAVEKALGIDGDDQGVPADD